MAEQRIDASLDAFDTLIADLAAAGEVSRSEVEALRRQLVVPATAEIAVQPESRWAVPRPAVEQVPAAAEPADRASSEPASQAQPLTRREARRLREAQEAALSQTPPAVRQLGIPQNPQTVEDVIDAENLRRAERQIRSRRLRSEQPAATPAAPAGPRRRSPRRSVLATIGAFALIPSLWLVVPATADVGEGHPIVDGDGRTAQQILHIADDVSSPTVHSVNYVATAIASIVAREGGASAEVAAPAIVSALQLGGPRQQIIETALGYIGTRYVLGGASHTGIDCSGLTMVAYAAAGIPLTHYVPTQDAVGTRIDQADARPGDLVVFDNEDHIGIYLGDNQVLAAPAPGRRVSIESVDLWRSIGIHFTRILPAGQ